MLGSTCAHLCGDRGSQVPSGYIGCGHHPLHGDPQSQAWGRAGGEEGGQRVLTDGDFCFTSRGKCTLAPGKGGELGGGVGREWYLQAPKVTTGEKRKKVANCHASPVLPGAELKHLQTAFPASSRWEACKVCILAPFSRGRWT